MSLHLTRRETPLTDLARYALRYQLFSLRRVVYAAISGATREINIYRPVAYPPEQTGREGSRPQLSSAPLPD